jgi:hypothetical protein
MTWLRKTVMKYVQEANEIAARLKKQDKTFLKSKEWKDLRRPKKATPMPNEVREKLAALRGLF